jgi:hypothetical protein
MKSLEKITLNIKSSMAELEAFRNLLNSSATLSEQSELLPFFKQHKHLCALMGQLHPAVVIPDLIANEYDLFGDFVCDFVIGDSKNSAFCFVEFEDAKENSIFTKGTRATPDWAYRFEHGFSQLVDWMYKLYDMEKSDEFENRFNARSIDVMGALIIGRSHALNQADKRRLKWREKFVLVNSQRIRCLTYDELFEEMEFRLNAYQAAIKTDLDKL